MNVECCIFVNNCFTQDCFSIFTKRFKSVSTTQSYNTISGRNCHLFVPSYNSDSEENQLSTLQDKLNKYDFHCLSLKSLRILLIKDFISAYNS